jgi:FkbM family methyltransferase
VVLVTPPCSREEICADLEKYIDRERIVKYPGLLVYNSKGFRNFIREHEETISKFYDILADEESKETFENWLKGKVTCDISWFCRSCIPNPYVNLQQFPMEMFYEKGYNSDLYFKKELGRQVPYDSLFCTGLWEWRDDEVYFDCGAAYGDTYLGFVSAVRGRYQNIVLFEPEERVYAELKRLVGDAPGVKCIMSGISDKDTEIFTGAESQLGGVIIDETAEETSNEAAGVKISLRTIDSVSEELKITPTLIKMDIEGAEMSALKGAQQTIRTVKPKLAVCIYHKDEDLIEIPQYIHSLNPDYQMYVRHFDCSPSELVLFCV